MKNIIFSDLAGYVSQQIMEEQFNFPDIPEPTTLQENSAIKNTTKTKSLARRQGLAQTFFNLFSSKPKEKVEDCQAGL